MDRDKAVEKLRRTMAAFQEQRWNAMEKQLAAGGKKKTGAASKAAEAGLAKVHAALRQAFEAKPTGPEPEERLDLMTVPQLVKLYGTGGGAEDAVGPEFKRRGAPARSELIRMLDAMPMAELRTEKQSTLVEILESEFPSQKTYEAFERLASRLPDWSYAETLASLRAKLSGQMDAWMKSDRPKPPVEGDLQYVELLLANCRPADRVHFLARVAVSALQAFEEARKLKNTTLQKADKAKATACAREVLATADLAAKSGEEVHSANQVLGMFALYGGNLAKAKKHLIECSKAASSTGPLPDFSLASSLLERGECDAVCEYLDNLKASTKMDALIGRWKRSIRAGKMPELRNEWIAEMRKRRV